MQSIWTWVYKRTTWEPSPYKNATHVQMNCTTYLYLDTDERTWFGHGPSAHSSLGCGAAGWLLAWSAARLPGLCGLVPAWWSRLVPPGVRPNHVLPASQCCETESCSGWCNQFGHSRAPTWYATLRSGGRGGGHSISTASQLRQSVWNPLVQ